MHSVTLYRFQNKYKMKDVFVFLPFCSFSIFCLVTIACLKPASGVHWQTLLIPLECDPHQFITRNLL